MLQADGSRVLLDCGPGVLGRLRESALWPEVDAIAITHWHLDHWGDLVPWVWGTFYLARNGEMPKPALWVQPGGAEFLASLGDRLGFPDMFERTFELSEYEPDTPFQIGKLAVTPTRVPHYRLETYAFRVQSNGAVLTYSGDSAPSDRARRVCPRCGSLRVRGDAPAWRARRRAAWTPLARRGGGGVRGVRGEAAPRHAPARASCRRPTSSSSRTTVSSSRSDSRVEGDDLKGRYPQVT